MSFRQRVAYFFVIFISFLLTPFTFYYAIFLFKKIDFKLEQIKYLSIGLICSVLFIPFSKTLQWLYIFFHEVSHALAVIVFSGKIFSFKVGTESGHIKSNKDNFFIRLAPYLIPLLPYLTLLIHFLVLIYLRFDRGWLKEIYFSYFLISFLYGFVTFYNFKLIIRETSDIEVDKLALSFSVIINSYLFFSASLFYLLFKSVSILEKYYLIEGK